MAKALFSTDAVSTANLLKSCEVSAGGTVSKALVDTGTLKQILFAMDEGQSISDHRAPFVATVQVLDGRLSFSVAGTTHTLEAHDWIVMPPDAPHALTALKATRFLLTLIKG